MLASSAPAVFRSQSQKGGLVSFTYGRNRTYLKITFTRVGVRSGISHWAMNVGKPFQFHPDDQVKMDMGSSISECSQKQYLHLLDGSLTRFRYLQPNARLDDMVLGTYSVSELWKEMRVEMRAELSRVPGKKMTMHDPKNDNLNEPPFAMWAAPNRVLQKSETVKATQRVFRNHGFEVADVNMASEFWFKESLNGRSWSEISRLPDVGISTPGTIEFVITPGATSSK